MCNPDPKQVSSGEEASGCCSWRRIRGCFFCLVVAGGAFAGLYVAFAPEGGPEAFFVQEDPPGATEANRWGLTGRQGLELRIMNALDEKWTPYFDESVVMWDEGDPDALTLTTSREPYDPACEPYTGRMKVCNDDYGNTDWRGVNAVFIQQGAIVHSVARLNDYHFRGLQDNSAQRRYTMCHELGHGFGLPHTDERYYNPDRGDCMDYTVRPQNNDQPGQFNYELLAELYGEVPSQINGGLRGRNLQEPIPPMSEETLLKYHMAMSELDESLCEEAKAIIEGGGGGAAECQVDIGDGVIQAHYLLV